MGQRPEEETVMGQATMEVEGYGRRADEKLDADTDRVDGKS